ncbi:peritrophin-1-like [Ochlerotatus camptorhynchus]|uniref:peritrophin-1-like n=1 Tax=Ochlerotatus camptorhynchus TaxID=644619 RepID=UPI0031D7F5F8
MMKSFIVLVAVIAVVHGNSLICRNYRSGALVPNPENCAEFFMCRPGRAVQFTCPQNTKFNAAIQACDPTNVVRCKPGRLPLDIEYTPILALPSVIEHTNTACIGKQIATLLANPRSCSSFYQCSPTGVIAFDCPVGTLFDANRKYCERNDIASCLNAPVVPPNFPEIPVMPQLPALPPIVVEDHILKRCDGQRQGTQIRHPFNCNQYVQCSTEGRSKVFTCPQGTAFDEARATCDWERNVKC